MYALRDEQVSGWRKESNRYLPSAIDCLCPGCGRLVAFSITKWNPAPQQSKISAVKCPACRAVSRFFLLDHSGVARELSAKERLFIDRRPAGRDPLASILESDEIPDALQRAYESAVNVFNTREWSGTAVLTRRLLEGVTKSLISSEDQKLPLAAQVEKLPAAVDLSEPITRIADAVRKGGNLGAHFDLEAEPDEHVARLMLGLVEELLEYLFVLPGQIQQLQEEIEKLSNDSS